MAQPKVDGASLNIIFKEKMIDINLHIAKINEHRQLSKFHSDIKLLDLSAAFGIEHEALSWMKSYLSNRFQDILIVGCKSAGSQVDFGLPYGSVLGPKIYYMYTNPLGEVIKQNGFIYH